MKPNKLNFSFLSTSIVTTCIFFICLTVFTSCGTKKHSVRDMREKNAPYIPKSSSAALIEPLYLISKKPSIALPAIEEGRQASISETVVYKNADNQTDVFSQELDPQKTYNLGEIVVEAKSTFAPERNGRIDVDFYVRVPKEILSTNWCIKLQPYVVTDSTTKVPRVVIKGQQFAEKQKRDYQAYEDYLNSIVPKEAYDSVFLDHNAIIRDIEDRQKFYYARYQEEWEKVKEYEEWMQDQKIKNAAEIAKIKGEIAAVKYEFSRKYLEHSMRNMARGMDTTGLKAYYNIKFRNKTKGKQKTLYAKKTNPVQVPKRYQFIHENKLSSADIRTLLMTSRDTLNIAVNRYDVNAIIDNEMKRDRKDQAFNEIVRFKYEKNARIDSIVDTDKDFSYFYRYSVPVTPGMKNAQIFMKSLVLAVDESKYTMPRTDSLTYFIASIAQLADTTLLHKETVRNRNASNRDVVNFKFRPQTWRFDINYKDNKEQMNKLVGTYNKVEESNKYEIDSIALKASTSLTGNYSKNAELSMRQVQDVAKYITKTSALKSRGTDFIKTSYIGEDWNLLAREIKASNELAHKDEIMDIILNTTQPDKSEDDIKEQFPDDYKIIKDNIYPKLDKMDVTFYLHRKGMTADREVITPDEQYIKGVRLLMDKDYNEAMQLLADYPDYNAAVCLTALGYNAKAYEVIIKLQPTGNTEYLAALLAWRMSQKDIAKKHLIKSVTLDENKIFRLGMDSEINELVEEFNLRPQLESIHGN